MGLTASELEQGELFPFKYLQRTGAGSRTLCVPSVAESFDWSGRQVSTLAKSGGIIYIWAEISLVFELYEVCTCGIAGWLAQICNEIRALVGILN